jgi:methylenetetrahydrofolate dehydrogenase (NADP+)/methenyltetrahydrofolate cyclohydrolase
MTATLIDGKAIANKVLAEVSREVARRLEEGRSRPHLATLLVGDDPASETYVRMKRREAEETGIKSSDHRLPASATTQDVIRLVAELNLDDDVSGILVQLPLPAQVDEMRVIEAVDPSKDVDGFHPRNQGLLLLNEPRLVPCTPAGIIRMLDESGVQIERRRAVVVGRSNIVGKPVALLLLARHATVTVAHSRTTDLGAVTSEADILVAAVGRADLITPDMVKPGAAVIDVGVNRVYGRQVGDVAHGVREVAGLLSPSPGGVGPMTRAMLVRNTLLAEQLRRP